jgi:nucleotide-binding universal stress UspA family protein
VHALTIVCPVDYSDCSKRALRFAGALTERFRARLIVLHVFDPMLVAATSVQQLQLLGGDGENELHSLVRHLLPASVCDDRLELILKMGRASAEILKLAAAREADLLVLGTHGFGGVRKLFYGSTLQAVLADARVPVLAVPLPDNHAALEAPLISSGPALAPVDFSPESWAAAQAAAGLARALNLDLTLLHAIVAPSIGTLGWQHALTAGERSAKRDPSVQLAELAESIGGDVNVALRIMHGEPAEQIARYVREKQCALIVMSLGSSAMRNRRPGSIAYRVLRLAPAPVLALPENAAGRLHADYLRRQARAAGARC